MILWVVALSWDNAVHQYDARAISDDAERNEALSLCSDSELVLPLLGDVMHRYDAARARSDSACPVSLQLEAHACTTWCRELGGAWVDVRRDRMCTTRM